MTQTPVTALKPTYYSGKHYNAGEKFEIASDVAPFYVKEGIVVEREPSDDEVVVVETQVFDSPDAELTALEGVFSTDVDISADEYLKKFPDGPMSDVAMRIVELRAEKAESTQQ